jgi:hypothetical protein
MEQPQGAQLHIGHLKNVLILARHGIAAIGIKLPAQEGKAAYESLGEVEKFLVEFEKIQGAAQQAQQAPQAPQGQAEPFEVHTVKIE